MATKQPSNQWLPGLYIVLVIMAAIATLIGFFRDYWIPGIHLIIICAAGFGIYQFYIYMRRKESPITISKSDILFLENQDWNQVKNVSILVHTGKSLYTGFEEFYKTKIPPIPSVKIRVLTRAPSAETESRSKQIDTTLNQVSERSTQGWDIDIRHYHTLPWLRGYLVEYKDDTRKAFIGFYRWDNAWRSKRTEWSVVVEDTTRNPNEFIELFHSWFEHYWGEDDLHTIVFDFDDTLFETMSIQVDAWAATIENYLQDRRLLEKDLEATKIRPAAHDGKKLKAAIKDVFIEYQLAEDIVRFLLPDVDEGKRQKLNQDRFKVRVNLMKRSRPFDGLHKVLENLHNQYHLAIVSSTSEDVISKALKRTELGNYFPVVLGKLTHGPEIENISAKASLLLKLSNLTGVSFERMVFVGDNKTDYLAARQVGVRFMEARMVAKNCGVDSLIDYRPGDKEVFFTSYEDDNADNFNQSLKKLWDKHA